MKNVTLIMGSPRKNGNTGILLNETAKGLKDTGACITQYHLNDMNIRGCQACCYCKRNNTTKCIIDDDMQLIYNSINSSDAIVVATPIYFGSVTAQTKLWQDRLYSYIDFNARTILPERKKAAYIFTQNQENPMLFQESIKLFMNMLRYTGFDNEGHILACNLDTGRKAPVTENREITREAYDLGLNLI